MASSNSLTALRNPGTITFDGNAIGLLAQIQVRRDGAQTPVPVEEFGREVVDSVFVGATYRIGLALRGWDTTAINAVFPNVTGTSTVNYPGVNKAGYFRRADAAALAFTPKDAAHPAIALGLAIPELAEDLVVDLAARREHLILCTFLFVRDGATPEGGFTWGL